MLVTLFSSASVLGTPSFFPVFIVLSGDEGTRTPDFCFAKAALSQLSYIPGL